MAIRLPGHAPLPGMRHGAGAGVPGAALYALTVILLAGFIGRFDPG